MQKLEDKPTLSASERLLIIRHKKKLEGYYERFKEFHGKVLEALTEDADLETEHTVLECHEEAVAGLEEQLQLLQLLSAPGE